MDYTSKYKKIYLIEDDNIDIMVFKRAMKQLNVSAEIKVFSNGEEYLDFMKENNVSCDIMFLDLNTPRMNGLELLKILSANRGNNFFPIIILSSSDEGNDVSTAYRLMANGYIMKSISFNNFVDHLDIVLKYWNIVKLPIKEQK